MMLTQHFYDIFYDNSNKNALIFNGQEYNYSDLIKNINHWKSEIENNDIKRGETVALFGDFTFNTISILFALIDNENIIVPLDFGHKNKSQSKLDIAFVDTIISVNRIDDVEFARVDKNYAPNSYYETLKSERKPGLVLFTSGTSGNPKAAVHDLELLLNKFKAKRRSFKTLNFLLFDHWGGLNTMFHTLSNAGVVLALKDRRPGTICSYIEKYGIELLPTSPSFLNVLLISEEYKKYDLSSLTLITYGSEPMPQSTLIKIKDLFPKIKLLQTYGLIELGVLQSKSKSNDSLWVKVGGEGFQTRIVDDLLEIKSKSAMLGYLNAPSPFTIDNWFMTGDEVEVDGDYIRILGRKSELINVGGEKVYPQEVENIILKLNNVAEVRVYSKKNPIVGNMICADVKLVVPEGKKEFKTRLKFFCKQNMEKFKIPVKIEIVQDDQFNDRFKKVRSV